MNIGRIVYRILAWAFLGCIVIQVFLAGMATFGDPSKWLTHSLFVKIFAMVPLAMFLLAFIGGIKGRDRFLSLALFLLVVIQFLTVQVFSSVFVIAALHPLIAMLLFWGSIAAVRKA
ncbi:hypothetical protein AN963_10225 [Brevibacillus choshinensis]|uniref:Uncharacterized protein n=1 Tax=Brevibacillus choshinensis TaxID=54911 RepID=A0ABR5NF58_BRECH|nr:DUF6220 domain-containing protein [Brevibacillus choshinensis]KQL50021.1 hypothetical protein AN963_10225 [Brevibacillus choshinensis]